MAIRFRAANADDVASLVALDSVAATDDGSRRQAIHRWVSAGDTRVAEIDGEVVGYCVVEENFFDQAFVTMVMVAPRARGHGVGAGLLDDAQRRRRTEKIFTSTNLSNHPMQRLLARSGWRSAGIVYGLDEGDPELFFLGPER
ncbi:Ribosomal protein S18 acetylase RimI [Streptoalloteichus tenebrarius]|uniref:Ribosomal protein S18 acetylase RimI n=1 Tax=Streptoalloteichus tenebrarius (strain ATCC 17920 / DSM 40477 / JCM 4838 / CBS 697.72 / NBRC 16177 / NCIMB 11028 / NRRL B-12390 / A12253. 1 / ISP 5477) TaxID=1933 RepID=A0ABT1I1M2_STRSD|nr:GNAT family N-acetyltransferase [Streptoalloteichus tenebrarius]MCP2261664.1 Ribosomal protein S18 acetylase RimI [Streptoalloteichus tenebrarius]